jgi:hypothetical protein
MVRIDDLREMNQILTEVSATVDPAHHEALVRGFEDLWTRPRPEGLLRTELIHVQDEWRIQTLWRDRNALTAMRSSNDEPAAPTLFRSVGADPHLTVLSVRAAFP